MEDDYILSESRWPPDPLRRGNELLAYHQRSAENGDSDSQFFMGHLFHRGGLGVAINFTLAAKWYQMAAQQGHAGALNNLGILFDEGKGVDEDPAHAMALYQKAAAQGTCEAFYNIASLYHRGRSVKENAAEVDNFLKSALLTSQLLADKGDAVAQCIMGRLYSNLMASSATRFDSRKAERWFRQSAEQGYADAQYFLGYQLLWYHSPKTESTSDEAIKWSRLAAEQGHVLAQVMLWDRVLDRKAHPEYLTWLLEAANHGHDRAQYLAGCYYEKSTNRTDLQEALHWHRKAMAQGWSWSELSIGDMYMHGTLFPKDYAKALAHYLHADVRGAAMRIAEIYREGGFGVTKDDALAEHWAEIDRQEDLDVDDGFVL